MVSGNDSAIVIFEKAQTVLIECKPVNDYMAYARFKRKFCNISVINVYASTIINYRQMTTINFMKTTSIFLPRGDDHNRNLECARHIMMPQDELG